MKYGNIPKTVLNMLVPDIYNEGLTIKELIDEITDQDIIDYKIHISSIGDEEYLETFSAWTQDHLLVLLHSSEGSYMVKYDRNPTN